VKRMRFVVGLLVASMLIAAPLAGTVAGVQVLGAPRIPVKEGTSSNWSGYAVFAAGSKKSQGESWTYVSGTWTVPTVSPTAGVTSYSSIWVGLDGYNSGTVEQIGTEQDVSSTGSTRYTAWYELYPKMPVTISYAVSPGDRMTASVSYVGKSSFTLTISDDHWNAPFQVTRTCANAKRSSAEWIVEAPWSGGVLPLADFGVVTFSDAAATSSKTAGPVSISSFTKWDSINMVSGSVTKAATSGLTDNGTGFTVTWKGN
jgi:hypothetical protein